MQSVKSFIPSFSVLLKKIDISNLSIEGYPKEYMKQLLDHHLYYLHIYADVLDKALKFSMKPKEEIVLLDYGAGNGLLGYFAKHCGFKKVYLNDLNQYFLDSARQLETSLAITPDGYILGEVEGVKEFCKKNELPDVVVGTDVIEHIYNLGDFFKNLHDLNHKMVTVFTTASVIENRYKTRQLMKLQYDDEHTGSNAAHAIPGDEFAGKPFLEIRKKLIERNATGLKEYEINQLAVATRGMNKKHIISAVNNYTINGVMPKPPLHPTNTCDPLTGSWTERLLTVDEYKAIYEAAGFHLHVYNGFYNQWQPGLKSLFLRILNSATAAIGRKARWLTSYIILVGNRF